MVKKCKPPKKVTEAAITLSTSKSKKEKSKASEILNEHKKRNH